MTEITLETVLNVLYRQAQRAMLHGNASIEYTNAYQNAICDVADLMDIKNYYKNPEKETENDKIKNP